MAALCLACFSPYINPAAARLPPTFAIQGPAKERREARRPAVGLRCNYTPLRWDQYRPPRSTRKHLPIEALCHSIISLAREVTLFPLASPHLLPRNILPPDPSPKNYKVLKGLARTALGRDWSSQCSPQPSYPSRASLTPHRFMGLDHFTAGRIHQMRSGASYLAGHTSWDNPNPPTLCPACEEEVESFPDAILHCPVKSNERSLHLPGVDDVGPDSPLLYSLDAILGLANYIKITHTGFPPHMPALGVAPPSPSTCPSSPSPA